MRSILFAAATALALSPGIALAQGAGGAGGQGGGGGGNNAVGNSTSTSTGAPIESPNYSAPRSAAVPGTPNQQTEAQQMNSNGVAREKMMERGKIPQAPQNPITGHAQTSP